MHSPKTILRILYAFGNWLIQMALFLIHQCWFEEVYRSPEDHHWRSLFVFLSPQLAHIHNTHTKSLGRTREAASYFGKSQWEGMGKPHLFCCIPRLWALPAIRDREWTSWRKAEATRVSPPPFEWSWAAAPPLPSSNQRADGLVIASISLKQPALHFGGSATSVWTSLMWDIQG